MKRYFVIGTDTDSGKTYVTRKLIDVLPHAWAIKPIASGCSLLGDHRVSADALYLEKPGPLTLDQINPWRFSLPASPHIAAFQEGREIKLQEVADYCLNLECPQADFLIIEGAGGLMVPLNQQETWVDFLLKTQIPVLFVVGMKLGCINHALLTQTALNHHGIVCAGWVANCLDPQMLALEDNIQTLINKLHSPLIAKVPYLEDIQDIGLHLLY